MLVVPTRCRLVYRTAMVERHKLVLYQSFMNARNQVPDSSLFGENVF